MLVIFWISLCFLPVHSFDVTCMVFLNHKSTCVFLGLLPLVLENLKMMLMQVVRYVNLLTGCEMHLTEHSGRSYQIDQLKYVYVKQLVLYLVKDPL